MAAKARKIRYTFKLIFIVGNFLIFLGFDPLKAIESQSPLLKSYYGSLNKKKLWDVLKIM